MGVTCVLAHVRVWISVGPQPFAIDEYMHAYACMYVCVFVCVCVCRLTAPVIAKLHEDN